MQAKVGNILIEALPGDITKQADCAAIVNAANAWLTSGGGVAGAIHRAAGPGLEAECKPLAPIKPGQAVLTGAHNLPNRFVIHCLGPVYNRDQPSDRLLADCYRNALALADGQQIDCIAFPAISTGVFGYPLQPAAAIAVGTVANEAKRLDYVKRVRFVLFGEETLAAFEQQLQTLLHEPP